MSSRSPSGDGAVPPVGPLDHLALHAFNLDKAGLRQPRDQLRSGPAVGRDDRVVEGVEGSSSLSKKPRTNMPAGARSRRNSVNTADRSAGLVWMVENQLRMPATHSSGASTSFIEPSRNSGPG